MSNVLQPIIRQLTFSTFDKTKNINISYLCTRLVDTGSRNLKVILSTFKLIYLEVNMVLIDNQNGFKVFPAYLHAEGFLSGEL